MAVVEAYVLRSRRGYLSMPKIREAAEAVPLAFGDEYGLTTRRIATDGVDIFVAYADGGLARARDGQRPIREVITDYVRYIGWESGDQYPYRLCLRQYPDVAPVRLIADGELVVPRRHREEWPPHGLPIPGASQAE
ncbi:hypothetical protein [Streptomyces sp. DSM 41534]